MAVFWPIFVDPGSCVGCEHKQTISWSYFGISWVLNFSEKISMYIRIPLHFSMLIHHPGLLPTCVNGASGHVLSIAGVVELYIIERSNVHYCGVIMGAMASQITSLTIVYLTVHSGADQRKHESSASLAFLWGIHRWPVNSPHKWPVPRKMFSFGDVIMFSVNFETENVV